MGIRLIVLLVVVIGLAACSLPRPLFESLAGTLDSVTESPVPVIEAVALAPRNDENAVLELGFALEREFDARGIAIDDEAPLRLVYGAELMPFDEEEGYLPDIAVGGTIGSAGSTDIGIGIGLPIYGGGGGGSYRSYRFIVETTLETRDGSVVWRGRAAGAAELYSFKAVARTVAPLLLDRIGTTAYRQPFTDRAY